MGSRLLIPLFLSSSQSWHYIVLSVKTFSRPLSFRNKYSPGVCGGPSISPDSSSLSTRAPTVLAPPITTSIVHLCFILEDLSSIATAMAGILQFNQGRCQETPSLLPFPFQCKPQLPRQIIITLYIVITFPPNQAIMFHLTEVQHTTQPGPPV